MQGNLKALQEIQLLFHEILPVTCTDYKLCPQHPDHSDVLKKKKKVTRVQLCGFLVMGTLVICGFLVEPLTFFPGSCQTAGATLIFFCLLDKYILARTSSCLLEAAAKKNKWRTSTSSSRTTIVLKGWAYFRTLAPDCAVRGVVVVIIVCQ